MRPWRRLQRMVKGKAKPGTIAALVDLYWRSRKWSELSEGSKRTYHYILDPFVAEHGHRRVDQMEAKHIDVIMDAKANTPVAANRLRKLLSVMMRIAIRQGWRKDNPVLGVDNFKIRSKGHRTWTVEEVAAFEAFYPIGTEERLPSRFCSTPGKGFRTWCAWAGSTSRTA